MAEVCAGDGVGDVGGGGDGAAAAETRSRKGGAADAERGAGGGVEQVEAGGWRAAPAAASGGQGAGVVAERSGDGLQSQPQALHCSSAGVRPLTWENERLEVALGAQLVDQQGLVLLRAVGQQADDVRVFQAAEEEDLLLRRGGKEWDGPRGRLQASSSMDREREAIKGFSPAFIFIQP